MRSLFALALTAASCLLALPQDGHGAFVATRAVLAMTAYERPLVLDAKFVCGRFDGAFTCKNVPGPPSGYKGPPVFSAPAAPAPSSSEPFPSMDSGGGGSISQPPSAAAQTCPKNTELLGGNCVPYTAQCKNGLAAEAPPQPCMGAEEKQVCKPRADGLKDCCCITYSKF